MKSAREFAFGSRRKSLGPLRQLAVLGASAALLHAACAPNLSELEAGNGAGGPGGKSGAGSGGGSVEAGAGGELEASGGGHSKGTGGTTGGSSAAGGSGRDSGGRGSTSGRGGGSSAGSGATTEEGGSAGTAGSGAQGGSSVSGATGEGGSSEAGAGVSSGDSGEGGAGGEPPEPPNPIVEASDVALTWSGFPTKYAFVTRGDRQFAGFWSDNRKLSIASRRLGDTAWQVRQIVEQEVGWDSHDSIHMALDSENCLHLSGNMHNAPLVYYRMERPFDISSLQVVPYMTGLNESSCTYPDFFTGPLGELVFMYRFGSSGSGNQIFNSYDTETKIWTRLLGQPLLDGEGANNAYLVSPVQGPDGYFHITWVWRATPNAETNHDVGYARSRDLVNWENGLGQPLTIPIKLSSPATVDPVPQYGGVINNNTKIGFDAEGRAVVVYHKYDSQGNTQLYNARVENGAWVRHQTTNWSYRWNFSGGGTLVFEVEIEPIQVHPNGQITQRFYRIDRGWGAYLIDPVTLTAIEEIDPPLPYPRHLDVPESTTPGMHVRWAFDSGSGDDPDVRYMLRWESLDSNRDMPRETIPPPTQLRLYAIKSSALALAPE